MENEKIKELLKAAEKESKKTAIPPRTFKRTDDGKLILDPSKQFDKDWYENDEAYDIL
ncbi:hypothetical protein [Heyndrickxia ginsengihumi]|uniref:hypothetical protein n=1 Tax=Heyndrickxia ginsengihumi TaxID=363870 RepID=UPI0004AD39F9|nr:hypothetical protein [Heyndrickxia ginsengihumi]